MRRLREELEQVTHRTAEERAVLAHLQTTPHQPDPPMTPAACSGWYLGPVELQQTMERVSLRGSAEEMWQRFNHHHRLHLQRLIERAKGAEARSVDEDLLHETTSIKRAILLSRRYPAQPFRLHDPEALARSEHLSGLGLTTFEVCLRRGEASRAAMKSGLLADLSSVRSSLISANQILQLLAELQIAQADIPDPRLYQDYAERRVARLIGGDDGAR